MKGEFILKFLKGTINTGKEFYAIYNWTPLYYKGFYVSGPNYKKTYSGFKNLEHRGIIKKVSKSRFKFTEKGKVWLKSSSLKYYKDMGIKWDRKWRIIIFDIPQEFHNKRNQFRKKLKSSGFYMIQKSVFAFPYPCEKELFDYTKDLQISEYINIIEADNLGSVSQEVKKFYNL
ncbi:MAG: CRISPR-associated endonuclease Cas2 [Candidatus Paceibacterota bacterium]